MDGGEPLFALILASMRRRPMLDVLYQALKTTGWWIAPPLASLALYSVAILLVAIYHFAFRRRARYRAWALRDDPEENARLPMVSILKPLCGHDEELERNLVSYALLDYPRFEIICRAEDPFDPALAIARRVAKRFPHIRFLVIGGDGSGAPLEEAVNPKVVQLEAMRKAARGDILLLTDSNVRIHPMDLRALVAPFADPRCGLVYQPFYGEGEATLGAAVENARNTEFPGMLCIGARLVAGQVVVTAKGILVRREALDAINGFAPVREYHNDDHLLAVAVASAGWRLRMAPIPAREIQVRRTLHSTIGRHARHAAGRWRCCILSCFLELLFNPCFLGLPLLLFGTAGAASYGAITVSKWGLELAALRLLRGLAMSPRFWLALPLKDFLMPLLLVQGLIVNRVEWRGRVYRMGWRTRLEPIGGPRPTPSHALRRKFR